MSSRLVGAIKGAVAGLLVGICGVVVFGAIGLLLLSWLFPRWDMQGTFSFAVNAGVVLTLIGGLIGWGFPGAIRPRYICLAVGIIYAVIPTALWMTFGGLYIANSFWEGSDKIIEGIQAGRINWGAFVGRGFLTVFFAPVLFGLVFGVPLVLSMLGQYIVSNLFKDDDDPESGENAERRKEE